MDLLKVLLLFTSPITPYSYEAVVYDTLAECREAQEKAGGYQTYCVVISEYTIEYLKKSNKDKSE